MNIKGSLFIRLVKIIKSEKSGAYDKYLTDKDREIISQKIINGSWYPFETYKHCITALFEVVGKKNPETAKEWGRQECQAAMTTIYKAYISGDPMSFLKRYGVIHKSFHDFGDIDVLVEGESQATFKISNFDAKCVPFYYLLQGWLERGMELCGAKNITCAFLTKSWEGHPDTSLRLTWTK